MNKTLEKAIDLFRGKKFDLEVLRSLPSGKEADVYVVEWSGKLYALKVYKDYAIRSFKKDHEYLAGKYMRRPSERKAVKKRTKLGKNLISRLWVKREFYLLKKLFDAGADIPKPIEMINNAILMEYIGDEMEPAPLLKDVKLPKKEAEKIYKRILKNIDIFLKCGIVHSDLSEFNVLYWNGAIFIIDFPQAVDIRTSPNTEKMLKRDKENVEKWYRRYLEEL